MLCGEWSYKILYDDVVSNLKHVLYLVYCFFFRFFGEKTHLGVVYVCSFDY